VPRGGAILDIGSHIGTMTVPFAKHVGPNGFVIAIESQRPIQALCQANAAINSLYNVRSINAAVDASHDNCLMTVSFDVDEFRNYGSHSVKECSEAIAKACSGGRSRAPLGSLLMTVLMLQPVLVA
jgi:FkbM family methyltransferase